jgi:solute carrier family 34 (sodium-dependent phosphate cotransporter)
MGLIVIIKFLLDGLSVRVVHAVTRCNGYVGIVFGGALTVLAQSSQVVVCTLVPFAGVGALPLEAVYPIVVGSNVGTALQTVMTSLSAFGAAPLQVALAHLLFNITGFALWYPLPHLRAVPLWLAGILGHQARVWKLFPIVCIVVLYVVVPFAVFGLSELYLVDNGLAKAFVILFGAAGVSGLAWTVYWCHYRNGREKYLNCVSKLCRRRSDTVDTAENTAESNGVSVAEKSSRKLAKGNSEDRTKRPCRTTFTSSSRELSPYDSSPSFDSNSSSEAEA